MMKYILIILSLMPMLTLHAQSNEGTDFWLTFMEHIDGTEANQVVMITSRTNTSGQVTVPGIGFSEGFTVAANEVVLVDIPSSAQFIGSEEIRNLGVNVTSIDPVSVYLHQYSQARSEAALILPVDALSNSYYTMSYTGKSQGNNNRGGVSEFAIVGVLDDTEIVFTVADDTQEGITSGTSTTITLNKGEVYQVRSVDANADLTSSFITGDGPFAVFSGSSWSAIPAECGLNDNIVEQMPPIAAWGTEFITTPTVITSNDFDIFRVLASENNTLVTIESESGAVQNNTLNSGEFYEFRSGEANYISCSNPVIVAQYLVGSRCTSRENGDPAMLVINAVEQIRDTITMFSSGLEDIEENYISIISRNNDKEGVFLDGNPIANWSDFGDYAYSIIAVNNGAHTIASSGCGVIASAFGLGSPESYAYGGGASFLKINEPPLPDGGCLGGVVYFDSELPPERYDIIWNIGDGVPPTTDHQFEHTYSGLGVYPAEVIVYDNCFESQDTFYKDLFITLRQEVNVGDDNALCYGEEITLEATDSGIDVPVGGQLSYLWTGPNNFDEETLETTITIANAVPDDSGFYEVTASVSGCQTFPDSIFVQVNKEVIPTLGGDLLYCFDQETPDLDLIPGTFDTYIWQDGSNNETYTLTEPGNYSVTVSDDLGCEAVDSIMIIDQCPTKIYMPNVFRYNSTSGNDQFGILGTNIVDAKLSIYDRWGNLVFNTEDYTVSWDGTFKGSIVNYGVYVYHINYDGFGDDLLPVNDNITGSVLFLR